MNVLSAGLLVACAGVMLAGCQPRERVVPPDRAAAIEAWKGITALEVTDVLTGAGPLAGPGSTVEVHYTGWLYDPGRPDRRGMMFDSSRDKGRPFRFRIGSGMVIRGWDEGLAGMQAGGTRQLVVPASMAYGERGAGGGFIPPGAALVFQIDLLSIAPR